MLPSHSWLPKKGFNLEGSLTIYLKFFINALVGEWKAALLQPRPTHSQVSIYYTTPVSFLSTSHILNSQPSNATATTKEKTVVAINIPSPSTVFCQLQNDHSGPLFLMRKGTIHPTHRSQSLC